jgi:TPR repeat protein
LGRYESDDKVAYAKWASAFAADPEGLADDDGNKDHGDEDRERRAGFRATLDKAKAGDLDAQLAVANGFSWRGRYRNDLKAAMWYRRAAAQGAAKAQFRLAHVLLHGLGTDRNPREAARWLCRAAAQGHAEAVEMLGKFALRRAAQGQHRRAVSMV